VRPKRVGDRMLQCPSEEIGQLHKSDIELRDTRPCDRIGEAGKPVGTDVGAAVTLDEYLLLSESDE
jgi:hypothetical protein